MAFDACGYCSVLAKMGRWIRMKALLPSEPFGKGILLGHFALCRNVCISRLTAMSREKTTQSMASFEAVLVVGELHNIPVR